MGRAFHVPCSLIMPARRVCVSACLLGERCRYDGSSKLEPSLVRALEESGCEVVPVCPEVLGGLPTPRPASEIRGARVYTVEGADVTAAFERGRDAALAALDLDGKGIDLAILQPKSPSCGVTRVYDGTFSGRLVPGCGVFARALLSRGITCLDGTDVGQSKQT